MAAGGRACAWWCTVVALCATVGSGCTTPQPLRSYCVRMGPFNISLDLPPGMKVEPSGTGVHVTNAAPVRTPRWMMLSPLPPGGKPGSAVTGPYRRHVSFGRGVSLNYQTRFNVGGGSGENRFRGLLTVGKDNFGVACGNQHEASFASPPSPDFCLAWLRRIKVATVPIERACPAQLETVRSLPRRPDPPMGSDRTRVVFKLHLRGGPGSGSPPVLFSPPSA